jgi:hypothetical protein
MTTVQDAADKLRRTRAILWDELATVCKKIHRLWYVKRNRPAAKRYLTKLARIMKKLPQDKNAIIRAEGMALLHELRGDLDSALKWRRKEIRLTELAQKSVRDSVNAGHYDQRMADSILKDRDAACLQERQAILQALVDERAVLGKGRGKQVPQRSANGAAMPS